MLSFLLSGPTSSQSEVDELSPLSPIPGLVTLKDGSCLRDIHRVLICTGYHISLPFLSKLHADDLPPSEADDRVLVTDGTMYHNLHEDIFYIPDPTLAFIGVPYYTATFSLFEFQAMVLAAVWAGHATLPPEREMRMLYEARVREKGVGRGFNSLKGKEVEYVDNLLKWINVEGSKMGRDVIEGHDKIWLSHYEVRMEKLKHRLAACWAKRE